MIELDFEAIKGYSRDAIDKMRTASCTKLEFSMNVQNEKWEVKLVRK